MKMLARRWPIVLGAWLVSTWPVAPGITLLGSVLWGDAVREVVTAAVLQTPATQPLLQSTDLSYVGAFRLPNVNGGQYAYGGTALSIKPDGTTMVVVGHDHTQLVGEVRIPTPGTGPDVASLPVAQSLVAPRDVLLGQRLTASPGTGNAVRIHGTQPLTDGGMIVTVLDSYDASSNQQKGHFRVSPDGKTVTLQEVGAGKVGFTAGWMVDVPADWRPLVGAGVLTGKCCVSIIARTSLGPSLSAWSGFPGPQAVLPMLLGYPIDHPTLGSWENPSQWWHGNTIINGAVWPAGTRSVLFFGRFGQNYCYGGGSSNPADHGKIINGMRQCYDPIYPYQGSHSYPYENRVWAYDANELASVKAGTKQPWDVLPYAVWTLPHPHAAPHQEPVGAAYNATTKLLYVSMIMEDGDHPLVHAWRVGPGSSPPPPPPPPAREDCIGAWDPEVTSAGQCVAGLQTLTTTRAYRVTRPASSGGASCLHDTGFVEVVRTTTVPCGDQPPDGIYYAVSLIPEIGRAHV